MEEERRRRPRPRPRPLLLCPLALAPAFPLLLPARSLGSLQMMNNL